MGFLYKSYCHETTVQVAAQIKSEFMLPNGMLVSGATGFFGNQISVTGTYPPDTTLTQFTYIPTTCTSPGYLPYLPGEISDFVPLWAAAMGVIAVAYAVRMAKVALGQGRS